MKLLKIEGLDCPPLCFTEGVQTIQHKNEGTLHRTVNGTLTMTTMDARPRYRTTIQCTGANVPALGDLCVGQQVKIHSIQRLWQRGDTQGVQLTRPPVMGSILVLNTKQEVIPHDYIQQTIIPRLLGRPYFVGYCPILQVCITDITLTCGAGGLDQTWTLHAEEAS